jgi:hypothetical protein
VSRAWHIRQNAILARTTKIRHRCLLEGCERELAPHRRKYCSTQHADVARQHRHREAEKAARESDPRRSYFGKLIADDGARGRLRLKRRSSLPILRRKGDGERIFDRVSPREGKLPYEPQPGACRDLAPKWGGIALSPRERELLEDQRQYVSIRTAMWGAMPDRFARNWRCSTCRNQPPFDCAHAKTYMPLLCDDEERPAVTVRAAHVTRIDADAERQERAA